MDNNNKELNTLNQQNTPINDDNQPPKNQLSDSLNNSSIPIQNNEPVISQPSDNATTNNLNITTSSSNIVSDNINNASLNSGAPIIAKSTLQQQPLVTSSTNASPFFANSNNIPKDSTGNASTYVLQWITYALRGWSMLALSWVIFALVLSMLSQSDMGLAIIYPISALIILLPASIVADSFYSKKETKIKKRASLVIMVIHAVIYILFMIGFLIGAMFSLTNLGLSSSDNTISIGTLISCILVSLCYALLITRTLRPQTFRRLNDQN